MAQTKGKARASIQRESAASSPPPRDVFPTFKDGEVKVVVTGARQYQLHANVLKNNSPVLRDLLDSVEKANLTNKLLKAGHNICYKLMLVNNPDEDAAPEFIFEAVPLDSNGRPIYGNPDGIGQDLENGKTISPTVVAYNTVLGAFYNVPIELGDAQGDGLTHLLSQALQVTTVAEYLECIHIITPPIESTLLATGQNLYRAISKNPCAWLAFAYRVRSKAIFKEALIHATGQYHTEAVQAAIDNKDMPEAVIDLLNTKGRFLENSVMTAERHLASYYPSVLMREATVGRVDRDNIGRANYANDIMMWIALSVFRHWCCDMIASDQAHHAEDMGFAFIQAIARGGDTYLSKQVLQQQFHQRFPMSPKGMACVEHRLAEIKDVVKQWADPLMLSNAALDLKSFAVPYFTNVNVTSKDYPWVENEVQRPARVRREDYGNDEEDEDEVMAEVPAPRKPKTTAARSYAPNRNYNNTASRSSKTPNRSSNNAKDKKSADAADRGAEDAAKRLFRSMQDEDMDDVESVPGLTDGTSANMSIDRLGDGDSEDDDEDAEIVDEEEGTYTTANTLARLRRAGGQPLPPSMRNRSFNSNDGGDTEPELDQSYQQPYIEEARRRREEREAVSSQGSQEALEE